MNVLLVQSEKAASLALDVVNVGDWLQRIRDRPQDPNKHPVIFVLNILSSHVLTADAEGHMQEVLSFFNLSTLGRWLERLKRNGPLSRHTEPPLQVSLVLGRTRRRHQSCGQIR